MAISQNSEILAKDIRKELRRNYLRSILSTTTVNEVTCTDNNDGTYTVGGKATSDVWLTLGSLYLPNGVYRLVGNKANSGTHLKLHNSNWSSQCADLGGGTNIEISGDTYELSIYVSSGTRVSNALIKPMITNDLEATYDDFVSYNDSFVTGINSGINMDLLWTNSNPTSEFASQAISNIGVENYKMLIVSLRQDTETSNVYEFILNVADYVRKVFSTVNYSNIKIMFRSCMLDTNGSLTFSDCYISQTYGAYSTINSYLIPYKIYGVK